MMLSQQATGLFHKAVSQSGGAGTVEMSYGRNYMDDSSEPGHINSSREIINNLLIADGAADRDAAKATQDGMTDQRSRTTLRQVGSGYYRRLHRRGRQRFSADPIQGWRGPAHGDPLTLLETRQITMQFPS